MASLNDFTYKGIGGEGGPWESLKEETSNNYSGWQGPKRDEFMKKILSLNPMLVEFRKTILKYNGNVAVLREAQEIVKQINKFNTSINTYKKEISNINCTEKDKKEYEYAIEELKADISIKQYELETKLEIVRNNM